MSQSNARYVTGEHITFKYAKGASERTGREFHTHHELIWFMGGQARFISEKIHAPLESDTLILIPRERYHQLLITGSQEAYHRCVFHFSGVPGLADLIEKSLGAVQLLPMHRRLQDLFRQMIDLAIKPEPEAEAVMQAILTLILYEIVKLNSMSVEPGIGDTVIDRCINYVNQKITEPLSVALVAGVLNVSESYLSHRFKRDMNISLHQYILKKRLVMAYRRIADGEPAVKAAMECGFGDYSGFYKQFCKLYGASPNRIVKQ